MLRPFLSVFQTWQIICGNAIIFAKCNQKMQRDLVNSLFVSRLNLNAAARFRR